MLKESEPKESRKWKYKEIIIDFTNKSKEQANEGKEIKAIQINMFD